MPLSMAKQSKLLLPFLPEDLVAEHILVRLPVKSVGRFRCVSKPWRSLLSSPKFAKAHLKIQADHEPEGSILVSLPPHFSFCTLNLWNESLMVSRISTLNLWNENLMASRSSTLPSYDDENHGYNRLQGSFHGLFLFKHKYSLSLFNPITRETLKIPMGRNIFSYDFGLGYDSFQNDYKIVCLPMIHTAKHTGTVSIYSVKMQTWRNLGNMPYQHCEGGRIGGLFVNGCLHWLAWNIRFRFVLGAFSLAEEEFKEFLPPKGINLLNNWCTTLTVLGGCLAMIFNDGGFMSIWVMKEYGVQDSWIKYTFNISIKGIYHVGVMGDDEIVFVKEANQKLCVANWRTGVSRNLVHTGIPFIKIDGIANFRESLVSPIYRLKLEK